MVSPTSSDGAKCAVIPMSPASYSLVGWRAGRIVVVAATFPSCETARYQLLSADPAVGTWTGGTVFDDGMPDRAATDGRTVAFPLQDRVVVSEASGSTRSILRPGDMGPDWDAYGLPALPGGGYLVVGADRLLQIASDGSEMTSDPLPAGYVAVAPTSDPDRFILAPTVDARREYGLSTRAPFRTYLWDRASGSLRLLLSGVTAVSAATPQTGLAFLVVTTAGATTWSLVAADGRLRTVATTAGWATLSPDGRLAVRTQSPDLPSVPTVLLDPRSDRVIAAISSLGASGTAWDGEEAATLVQPRPPVAGQAAVLLVDGARISRLELP